MKASPAIILGALAAAAVLLMRRGGGFLRPVVGRLSSPFGNRTHPVTGEAQFHNGCDYAVPVGTPVLAPAAATVAAVWEDEKGGRSVRLKCNSGWSFGFAHLSEIRVRAGERVSAGQVVALSGGARGAPGAGRSTGPHLHVTVRDSSDSLVNPEVAFS